MMAMGRHALGGVIIAAGLALGQVVSFNSPTAWVTERSSSITARTLIDTASVGDGRVTFTLSAVVDGRTRKISSESFAVEDYSQEFELGSVGTGVLGGNDYVSIEWKIAGEENGGTVEPVGVVELDESKIENVSTAKKISGTIDQAAVSGLSDNDIVSIGKGQVGAIWNDEALGLIGSGIPEGHSLVFYFDGKNAKSAFLAFSDRGVGYVGGTDSLLTIRHTRTVTDSGIVYGDKNWVNDISLEKVEGKTLVRVPWYDLAVLPFDGRLIGYSFFLIDSEGNVVEALPKNAQREIPGTWGNVTLVESGS